MTNPHMSSLCSIQGAGLGTIYGSDLYFARIDCQAVGRIGQTQVDE